MQQQQPAQLMHPAFDTKRFLDLEYGDERLDQYDKNRFRKLQ